MAQKVKFSSEKLFLVQFKKFCHSQNDIGFPKHQLGIQTFKDGFCIAFDTSKS